MDAWAAQQFKSELENSHKSFPPPHFPLFQLSMSNVPFTCLLQAQLLSINIQFHCFVFVSVDIGINRCSG